MNSLTAIFLGVVEGATEFLPISSTAHLLIVEKLTHIDAGELFNIAVQLGAIAAVIAYAPKRLFMSRKTQVAILTAFIPTAIIGFLVKDYANILHGYILVSISALFLGGIIMLILERRWTPKGACAIDDLPKKNALMVGALQAIAFIPGVSRSAATIYAGLAAGLSRKEAVAFSFFLGIPTMAAATFLSLIKYKGTLSADVITPVLIGGVAAFFVALFVMHAFMRMIENRGFEFFAWYRIVLAMVLAVVFFL